MPKKWISQKKGFREYFYEFVLVFLAVFVGFLAENFRENLSDRSKEQEFIGTLIQNLKDDSERLSDLIQKNERKQALFDSALLYRKRTLSPEQTDKFCRLLSAGYCCNYIFKSNDATMSQLKYNGGFRLLPVHVADKIASYDVKLLDVYREETHYERNNFLGTEKTFELGDFTPLRDPGDKTHFVLTADKDEMTTFYNFVLNSFFSVRGYNRGLKAHKIEADNLIKFLEAEYKL